ncbi:hypothetical protein KKF19_03050 [Patescibacteria group bacterium]|nr:hypothetical protein [Patescibacteria group bacterium]
MFAQFIITSVLVIGIGYLLWKYVGKPYIKNYGIDEESTEDDLPTLQRKIRELEWKKAEIISLTQEIETTVNLNEINDQLAELRVNLANLESKQ